MKVARPVRWEPLRFLPEKRGGDPIPSTFASCRFDSGLGHQLLKKAIKDLRRPLAIVAFLLFLIGDRVATAMSVACYSISSLPRCGRVHFTLHALCVALSGGWKKAPGCGAFFLCYSSKRNPSSCVLLDEPLQASSTHKISL